MSVTVVSPFLIFGIACLYTGFAVGVGAWLGRREMLRDMNMTWHDYSMVRRMFKVDERNRP